MELKSRPQHHTTRCGAAGTWDLDAGCLLPQPACSPLHLTAASLNVIPYLRPREANGAAARVRVLVLGRRALSKAAVPTRLRCARAPPRCSVSSVKCATWKWWGHPNSPKLGFQCHQAAPSQVAVHFPAVDCSRACRSGSCDLAVFSTQWDHKGLFCFSAAARNSNLAVGHLI